MSSASYTTNFATFLTMFGSATDSASSSVSASVQAKLNWLIANAGSGSSTANIGDPTDSPDPNGSLFAQVRNIQAGINSFMQPIITTNTATNVKEIAATLNGSMTTPSLGTILAYGFVYSTSNSAPTLSDTTSQVGTNASSGTTSIQSTLTTLAPNTTYYYRAYATLNTSIGTVYGTVQTLQTTTPGVSGATSVGYGVATLNGTAVATGTVTAYGFVYGTGSNPTLSNSVATVGTSLTLTYNKAVTGLSAGSTYYIRSYITNAGVTAYSSSQITVNANVIPTITTGMASATACSRNMSETGNSISNNLGSTVTAYGIVYSSSTNTPTLSDANAQVGTTAGTSLSYDGGTVTGYDYGITYWYRAYITGPWGTAYGSTTSVASSSYSLGATACGGKIFYDAGSLQSWGRYLVDSGQEGDSAWCNGLQSTLQIGTGAAYQAIGAGKTNTATAAPACASNGGGSISYAQMTYGGYSDWFLPSLNEWLQLYANRSYAYAFTKSYYWTSTESAANSAYVLYYSNGSTGGAQKLNGYSYRSIREF